MAVVFAVLIAALIGASVLAPAPRRSRRGWVVACVLLGVCGFPLALAMHGGRGTLTAVIAAGAALLAAATWLARGGDSGGGPGDGGNIREQPPEPPAPWDWSEFDRAREHWSRPQTTA